MKIERLLKFLRSEEVYKVRDSALEEIRMINSAIQYHWMGVGWQAEDDFSLHVGVRVREMLVSLERFFASYYTTASCGLHSNGSDDAEQRSCCHRTICYCYQHTAVALSSQSNIYLCIFLRFLMYCSSLPLRWIFHLSPLADPRFDQSCTPSSSHSRREV